jgi:putative intracellular protease/amidase
VRSKKRKVVLVVSNPAISPVWGPVGFWASELTHPWYELTEAGYEVEVASPKGGKVELDSYSDPRHESGYSADDILTRGFLETPSCAKLLEATKKLADVSVAETDAILVAGGAAPMFTFRGDAVFEKLLRELYEAEKVVAAICHGVCALLDVKLSNGQHLVGAKTITGFSNAEEDAVDAMSGTRTMPFRVEDVARERRANFVSAGLWRPFAVRDGRIVTGQQQYSGRLLAAKVIEALGV